jgi:hypothetical protein
VAVEIAQRELNSICHAVGKLRVADTEELHTHPMLVTLGIDDSGRNVPKGYRPATAAAPSSPGTGTAAAGASKTTGRGPWA